MLEHICVCGRVCPEMCAHMHITFMPHTSLCSVNQVTMGHSKLCTQSSLLHGTPFSNLLFKVKWKASARQKFSSITNRRRLLLYNRKIGSHTDEPAARITFTFQSCKTGHDTHTGPYRRAVPTFFLFFCNGIRICSSRHLLVPLTPTHSYISQNDSTRK